MALRFSMASGAVVWLVAARTSRTWSRQLRWCQSLAAPFSIRRVHPVASAGLAAAISARISIAGRPLPTSPQRPSHVYLSSPV